MLIEAGHGLLIQGLVNNFNQRPRSRLINMAGYFAGQFKLMATSLIFDGAIVVYKKH